MPSTDLSPNAAILAGVDWSGYAGDTVFTRSVSGAVALDPSVGAFDDLLDALNGYGSRQGISDQDLPQLLDAAWGVAGGLGNLTVGLDADDRFYIECDGESFTVTFSVQAPINVLGVSNGTVATGSGPWRVTASEEWKRREFYNCTIRLDGATSGAASIVNIPPHVQSVPTLLRRRDENDADGRTSQVLTLEDADNDAGGVDNCRWGIDADGHVWTAYNLASVGHITAWNSTALRDLLGFTGEESPVLGVSGWYKLTAANPSDYVLALGRGLAQHDRARLQSTSATQLLDGGMTSVTHLDRDARDIGFFVTGNASATDREAHYVSRFAPRIPAGSRVTVYPDWPAEHRRARDPRVYGSTDPGYSLTYTTQGAGRRGRFRGSRSSDGGGVEVVFERRLRHRSLQTFRLVERP